MDFSTLILAMLFYIIGRNSLVDDDGPIWSLGWFLLCIVWLLCFLFGELL